jgi:adenosine deaminase
MTAAHAYALARNSFDASFIDEGARRGHVARLDALFESFA